MDAIRSAEGKIVVTFLHVLQRSDKKIFFHERSWDVGQERCSETGSETNPPCPILSRHHLYIIKGLHCDNT